VPSYSPRMSNAAKKAFSETAILTEIRKGKTAGLTAPKIRALTRVAEKTLRAHLADLRAREAIHIGSWRLFAHQMLPAYVAGPGKDAELEDYIDTLGGDAENDMQDEVSQRHQQWAKSWKPNRPVEASWIR
jgi:hypothetical protein